MDWSQWQGKQGAWWGDWCRCRIWRRPRGSQRGGGWLLDGEKWVDVHQFGPCNQRVLRADLGGKLPLAKYVRILRPGGPEFFHLNAVYVYGNQAA